MTFLHQTYAGTVGYEYTHIRNREQVNWCMENIETQPEPLDAASAQQLLERLAELPLRDCGVRVRRIIHGRHVSFFIR